MFINFAYIFYLNVFLFAHVAKGINSENMYTILKNPFHNNYYGEVEDVLKNRSYLTDMKMGKQDKRVETRVVLEGDGEVCRYRECNFGNLVADAVVEFFHHLSFTEKEYKKKVLRAAWGIASVAVISGSVINNSIGSFGNFTDLTEDIIKKAVIDNSTLSMFSIQGSQLKLLMESGIRDNLFGDLQTFFQVSGIKIIANRDLSVWNKIKSLRVRCLTCRTPKYDAVDPSSTYKIFTTRPVAEGKYNHTVLKTEALEITHFSVTLHEAIMWYIKQRRYINPAIEGRITFIFSPRQLDNTCDIKCCVVLLLMCFMSLRLF